MNVGLVTSYIVAGIILLSILMMNRSVSQSSNELTMTQLTREKAATVTEMVSQDLQKMGYSRTAKTSTILKVANSHKIIFYSNIDNSTNNTVEQVTWEFQTDNEVEATSNPNDYVLMRIIHDKTGNLISKSPVELGVTGFNITYFDEYGAPMSDSLITPVTSPAIDNIKQLHIQISLQSPEKIYNRAGDDGRYILSVWEKRFSPPNLEVD